MELNSRYAVEVSKPILSTLAVLQLQDESRISAHEWEIIDNATKMLAVFDEVTKEISSEKMYCCTKHAFYQESW
jgi:hypothetical protein